MENLFVKGTDRTPRIDFNYDTGTLEFAGRFIPSDTEDTMGPVLDWLKEYGQKPQKKTVLNLYIEYFNTANSKRMLDFMRKIEKISNVTINWHYEEGDEDMYEMGEDFQIILTADFNLIGVEKEVWNGKMPF
jgi:NDP-sugar pyrophosphorylase family protein